MYKISQFFRAISVIQSGLDTIEVLSSGITLLIILIVTGTLSSF